MKTKRFISILMTAVMMLSIVFCAIPVVSADTTSKVTGLRQTFASKNGIGFSWKTQLGVNYYEVQMKESGSNNWITMSNYAKGSDREYNLNPATNYDVRVRVRDSYYNGEWSDVVTMGTACINVENLKETYAQTNSITFSWFKVYNAQAYQLCFNYGGNTEVVKGTTSNTSYTVKNLKQSSLPSYVYVKPVRYIGNNAIVENSEYYNYNLLYKSNLKLRPTKPSKLVVSNYYSYSRQEDIKIPIDSNADGYECKVFNAKGADVGTYDTKAGYTGYSYFYIKNVSPEQYYKIMVRGYIKMNNKKLYGAWSNPIYTHLHTNIKLKYVSSQKIKVYWGKVNGATDYTIYASDKQNSGYKKICTTKKLSAYATKIGNKSLKKGKTYYFYVIANKKVGKNTYHSGNKMIYYIKRFV